MKRKRTGEEEPREGPEEEAPGPTLTKEVDNASAPCLRSLSRFSWAELLGADAAAHRQSFCARLRRHGWAIISLTSADDGKAFMVPDAEAVIRRASDAAHRFFTTLGRDDKEATRLFFDEVGGRGKGFVGYNRPTPAKELYRLRRGPSQPWPLLEDEAFRVPVEAAFGLLELLVDEAMSWIDSDLSADGERRNLLWRYCGRGPPPLPDGETKKHDADDEETEKENASTLLRYSTSPFDLFHYYNSVEAESVINCSRHVDPGFMTVVPCAAKPGLEVLDAATLEWIRVEEGGRAHRDVALFCGQSLQTVSNGAYPGVVHWVSKSTEPRLSLVYELRPDIEERP